MNLLLDTHIVLWWLNDAQNLGSNYRELISNPTNICYISAATIWEISIKSALGKLTIPSNYVDVLRDQGFQELSVNWRHSEMVKLLPDIHRDPFGRMLIAQAQSESLILLSADEHVKKYNVEI